MWWWQVMDSNHRRLSRRFYRHLPSVAELHRCTLGQGFSGYSPHWRPGRYRPCRSLPGDLPGSGGPGLGDPGDDPGLGPHIHTDAQAERARQGEQGVHRGVVLGGFQPRHHRLAPAQPLPVHWRTARTVPPIGAVVGSSLERPATVQIGVICVRALVGTADVGSVVPMSASREAAPARGAIGLGWGSLCRGLGPSFDPRSRLRAVMASPQTRRIGTT